MTFFHNSTAGNGAFTNNGGAVGGFGGTVTFFDNSTAGDGTFTNNGATVSLAQGGETTFFGDGSSAGNATLIANAGSGGGTGGSIQIFYRSHGGTARVEVFGNGTGDSTNGKLDISVHHGSLTIGSIEGTGVVFLGSNNLTVGRNNLDTTFSGVIQDGGVVGGTGGSLTKKGEGKLVLTGANTYTGGTVIKGGRLLVNNTSGSGTGTRAVQVSVGTLGGTGTIAGAVRVGSANGLRAVLSPGENLISPGTLTINSTLTFNSQSTYKVDFDSSSPAADKVVANGVTIVTGVQFSFADHGTGTLTPGTIFTVIENSAATPIAGTFSNLSDNSTFINNGNTYKVSYEGGNGNDLTLTVQ